MLPRIDLRGRRDGDPPTVLPRAALDVEAAVDLVRPVVEDVRDRGAAAVRDATERFDGVACRALRVPAGRSRPALATSTRRSAPRSRRRPAGPGGPRGAAARRRDVDGRAGRHASPSAGSRSAGSGSTSRRPGRLPVQRRDERRAGAGRRRRLARRRQPAAGRRGCRTRSCWPPARCSASTRSTRSAGPRRSRCSRTASRATAAPVDVITGPGNVYVAAAKRLRPGPRRHRLRGGPDRDRDPRRRAAPTPRYVAADLVAQAEHDPNAACLLVTDSAELLDAVDVELATQVAATRHRERVERRWRDQSAHVLVDDIDHGLEVVDAWAPSTSRSLTADAPERAPAGSATPARSSSAPWAPVSLGDYLAGSNHVLPTGGTARFTAGLSAQSFLQADVASSSTTREALADVAPHVDRARRRRGPAAHVEAVQVRVR